MKTRNKTQLKYQSDALRAVHETASGLRRVGAIDKHKMKQFDEMCLLPVRAIKPGEIRRLRRRGRAEVGSHHTADITPPPRKGGAISQRKNKVLYVAYQNPVDNLGSLDNFHAHWRALKGKWSNLQRLESIPDEVDYPDGKVYCEVLTRV